MGEINHDDKASKTFSVAFASGAGSGMVSVSSSSLQLCPS
jgi:hypothetical protein